MLEISQTEVTIGQIYDTHPVEPTGSQVAALLAERSIPGVISVQANEKAANNQPPRRFVDVELTSCFGRQNIDPDCYEDVRSKELAAVYERLGGVVDIHNNNTISETYGMVSSGSSAVTMVLAKFLDIRRIVVIDWPGYQYFNVNPNLLVTEGMAGSPEYSAEWFHERLGKIAAGGAICPVYADDFQFFERLPDITMEQAEEHGLYAFEWQASFDAPLPAAIASRLGVTDHRPIYALAWPDGDARGYCDPRCPVFGELVVERAAPAGLA